MQEQFVTYKIAKKLKELGFNELCLATYWHNTGIEIGKLCINLKEKINNNEEILAPLWQQCIDYIRLIQNIDVVFVPPVAWQVQTYDKNMTVYNFHLPEAETIQEDEIEYHKAKEQAILKALEIIKNKTYE